MNMCRDTATDLGKVIGLKKGCSTNDNLNIWFEWGEWCRRSCVRGSLSLSEYWAPWVR